MNISPYAVPGVAATSQLLTSSQLLVLLQIKLGLISLGAFAVLVLVGWMVFQGRGAAYVRTRLKCPYFELTHESKNGRGEAKSAPRSSRKGKHSRVD